MSNPFDATASFLGYLFQCRWALLEALIRLRTEGSFTIALETLDDVVFDTAGKPIDLLQTKHHINRKGNLTDASEDLWKSMRIWIEGQTLGRWPLDTLHQLITTETAASGTIAFYLRPDRRDAVAARTRLDQVARTSESVANKAAYTAYLELSEVERLTLIERITVFDRSPGITDVGTRLEQELVHAAPRELVPSLVVRLEGWWFQRVVIHLASDRPDAIRSEELDAELDRLRPQFAEDNLPIDNDLLAIEIDQQAFTSHLFVTQLRLIDLLAKRIITAMRQYFRAKEQRSRWLREGFLLVGELDRYDRRLCEEWDIRFQAMVQDLGAEAAEAQMREAARQLYSWAEQEIGILIRPACTEPFVPRGSLQMLADSGKVGWHPQFLDRLKALVGEAEAS